MIGRRLIPRVPLAFLILMLGLGPAQVTAEPPERVFRLSVINDVPSTHLAVRLLTAAYKQLGITLETTIVPSRRALFLADEGRVDGDLFRVEEVASQYPGLVQVPYPLMQGRLLAIVPSGQKELPLSNGKPVVAAVRRGVIIAETTASRLGMEPVLANSYEQMRGLLERGRVDLLLVSDIEGLSPTNDEKWRDLAVLPEPVTRFSLFHYLNRKHSELVHPLADIFRELDQNGSKARFVEQARNLEQPESW
jgi:hypothetical protein